MATTLPMLTEEQIREKQFIELQDISWQTYKELMAELGNDRVWREVPAFIEQSFANGQRATVRSFRARIREILNQK